MTILSVITVVKGDPIGLRRTLESVHGQEQIKPGPHSWELVVVDGSTPSLEGVALSEEMTQLRYFWQEPAGIYAAMNFGVNKALGNYLLFLNAGDTLANPSVLGTLVERLESQSPAWAFGRVHFTSENGRVLVERDWNYDTEAEHLFARGVFPSHQGTVMQRDLITQLGGFDQSYSIVSDYQLMLRAHNQSKPLELGFEIAQFQQGGASTIQWRTAIGEFHRARVDVFQPHGLARIREWSDTARQYVATGLGQIMKDFRRG